MGTGGAHIFWHRPKATPTALSSKRKRKMKGTTRVTSHHCGGEWVILRIDKPGDVWARLKNWKGYGRERREEQGWENGGKWSKWRTGVN
jgi:DMSO/TMAO reductase YedYZ molybdopterin-dependent catalytic subunit